MTTPGDSTGATSRQESRVPDAERPQRDFPDTAGGPATTPGLVVSEERLADGRRITYYGLSR
ncbi:hypothetical protein [Actinomycetospora sp.]|jgi:hypothetical protein|uniref:hypothetical protein n=1 Tax=Actinomycetospora sp. TaxID=1872135 RepID=UPI002F404100